VGLECEFLPCFEFGNLAREIDDCGLGLESVDGREDVIDGY
jgi:hypothetical protein